MCLRLWANWGIAGALARRPQRRTTVCGAEMILLPPALKRGATWQIQVKAISTGRTPAKPLKWFDPDRACLTPR
jgi:hypothetical protein